MSNLTYNRANLENFARDSIIILHLQLKGVAKIESFFLLDREKRGTS